MNTNDAIRLTGHVDIVLRGPNGRIKARRSIKNLVVDAGKSLNADLSIGVGTAPSHLGAGTGATAANAADTALQVEIARVALTSKTRAGRVATYVANLPAGTATGALTEVGLLNAGAAGTLYARTVFAVLNKAAADSASVTWNITTN